MIKQDDRFLDKQAVVDVYERHRHELYRYAWQRLDDKELAEDCVAEIFFRFFVAARTGTSFENTRAYLYRVAHNWIMDHRHRGQPASVSLKDNLLPDAEGNPSHILAQKQDQQRMQSALFGLPQEQQQVITLRYLENRSHSEVADALGKTVEATRALQYRAIKTLRQRLVE